ncbi:hypothetical protein CO610_10075 [Lysobacteraceae bacterium NML95-0200]|nr:hypothetical protein CO610_10075 [Xanthomonadaceae bacterium NML95-0200]
MKLLAPCLVFIATTMLSFTAQAAECSRYEADKAQVLSENAGKQLIEKMGGGQDIRIRMLSCEFNAYNRKFRTEIEVYWNGAFIRSNTYNIDGVLTFGEDGRYPSFSQTYASQSVKDLKFWAALVGGAIILATLSAEGQSH